MTDHLDDDTFERLAMGELDERAGDAALAHIMRCPRCAAIHKALLGVEAGARKAGLAGVPVPASRSRKWIWVAAAAVAAAALVVVWIGRNPGEPSNLRGADNAVQLDAIGDIRGPVELSWRLMSATSYRVEVFDGDGKLVWSRDVTAPPARWPTEIVPTPAAYRWKVEALDGNTVVAESPLGSFRIVK